MFLKSKMGSVSEHWTSDASGDMGGGSSHGTPMHLKPFTYDRMSSTELVWEKSRGAPVHVLATQCNEESVQEPLFSPEIHHEVSSNCVDLLSTIPIPLNFALPGATPDDTNLPFAGVNAEKGPYDLQTDMAYQNSGVLINPPRKKMKSNIPSDITSVRVNQFTGIFNDNYNEARVHFSEVLYPNRSEMPNWEDFMFPLNLTLLKRRLDEGSYNVTQPHSTVTVAMPGTHSREASSSNATVNRFRRVKIAEGIKALQESCPCSGKSGKGTKESVLDDVIDYVKFLKLQIMALSQNRLGGEATYCSLIHLEGFGHYILHQQMPSEPLEEMVGQLMDLSMPTAIQFLGSKRLTLLPIEFADTLLQTVLTPSI